MTIQPIEVNGWTIAPAKPYISGMYSLSYIETRMRPSLEDAVRTAQRGSPNLLTGTPEEIDAHLGEVMADSDRLAFYQWIGARAIREAVEAVKYDVGEDPTPVEHRSYTQDSVYEYLNTVHPDNTDYEPRPSKLPTAQPYCDVSHHAHPDGKGRMPSCRHDSPE